MNADVLVENFGMERAAEMVECLGAFFHSNDGSRGSGLFDEADRPALDALEEAGLIERHDGPPVWWSLTEFGESFQF